MAALYVRLMDRTYLACIWLAAGSIFLMSLIIPWGVFSRYVLGSGSHWPEPVAILLMIVFTFFGAAASYRAGSHIAVAMLTDRLPHPLQKAGVVLVDLLMLATSAFVLIWGSRLVMGTWNQTIAELTWLPVGATYAPLPIGALLTMLFIVERMWAGSQAHRPVVRYDEQVDAAEGVA
jgi:TRAP-type C4-dicarboxylate transport system permease small subunit